MKKQQWYELRTKLLDNEIWLNGNDLVYALEDAKDFLPNDNISLNLLLKSIKESSLKILENARN